MVEVRDLLAACMPVVCSKLLVSLLTSRHPPVAAPNDICNFETYHGGLKCCSHKSILLSREQVPWAGGSVPTDAAPTNVTDNYRMKFRLYFEEYTNQSNAFFMFITDEAGARSPGSLHSCSLFQVVG